MPERRRHPGAIRAWAIWWVLCAALWLALVDRTPLSEIVLGAVAATIGATAAVLVRQQRERLLRPRARWLATAWRPVLSLFGDLWPLTRALVLRGVLRRGDDPGGLVELPFDAVGDDPTQTAYRVLTSALGSLGPNTIVVDVDPDRRVLVAHQLVPTDDPGRRAMPLPPP